MASQPTRSLPAGKFGRDLTTGSIPKHMLIFSLPMLAGTALQTGYSFINAIWVGQYLGKSALAAVTVSFPVIFVLIALAAGLTMGTTILISQHYGGKDVAAVRRVVANSTVLMTVLGLLLALGGELFTPQILAAMDTPADVMPLATNYLRIFLLSLPLGFGLFLVRSMLQGIGDSTTPLYYQGASVLLTTALDPVLMFGWLGAPKLGLDGTAWGSLISQAVALGALVIVLRKRGNLVAPSLSLKGFDWSTAWTTLRIGAPSAAQQSLISVSMLFLTGIVNGFGEDATAAFGAAGRVDQLAFMPAMTFSLAIATLAGQNIGANRPERVREILIWGCVLSGGVTLIASALAVALPRLLLRIFTSEQAVIDMGDDYLRIVGSGYLFFALMFVANGIINGSGHTMVTTLVSLVSLWVVRLPLAYTLSRHIGITGVWYSIPVSFFVSMVASMGYYATGWWRTPVFKGPRPAPNPADLVGDQSGEA